MYRLISIIILLLGVISSFAQSPHGDNFKVDCNVCHDPSGWSINMKNVQFDHSTTQFMLEGAHKQTDCKKCHTTFLFNEASSQCSSCHVDVHNMLVGDDCARCHNSKNWLVNNISEIHEEIGFPLLGVHGTLSCDDCHLSETNLRFDRIGNECFSCHSTDYLSTQKPNHTASGFSTNCIECHDILGKGWGSGNYIHDFFPLTLGHDIPECKACHKTSNFSDASPECVSCHLDNFNQTINPNHQTLNFTTECILCHTTEPGWNPAKFDNHNEHYQLNGAHALISNECVLCHNGDYNNTPNTCVGCHKNDYNNTKNPSHTQTGFSTDCIECHTETAWEPASFDHDAQFFPINSGKHKGEWDNCTDCHTTPGDYSIFTCFTCHTNPETDNNHYGMSGYVYESNACLACHPDGSNTGFDHNTTDFPLLGKHIGVDCKSCHTNGYQNPPSTDCYSCHNSDYISTTDPNHATSKFPTDCELCHTESGWQPSSFDHNATDFPLTGKHIGIDCNSCHSSGYQGTPTDCYSCHNSDYTSTTDPNHVVAKFSTDCEVCHTTSRWQPSSFDHNATDFPLTGKHIGVDCNSCHSSGYQGTPTDCNSCHNSDYTSTTDPNHVAAKFPTDCGVCHTTSGWQPSSFDHNATDFPLTGKHIGVDCNSCHSSGYQGTPTDCNSCHNSDYTSTTSPNHVSAQFSTDCELCHAVTGWVPSTFDHDAEYFPIYSGKHRGEWSKCTDCHSNTSNFSDFSCFACHGQSSTNNDHSEVSGYQYVSSKCLECHPDGSD